jgi:hypothetical protein
MPYIGDDAMETLDLFMTSIGRKGAWKLIKKKLSESGGCAEAIEQTKINKTNIATNVSNISTNTTNIDKNADDITELKDRLDNLVIEGVDKADPDDVDDWFGETGENDGE